jgi:hypothetical protein
LGGLSSRPLYATSRIDEYARALQRFTRLPLESIYSSERGTRTWLHNGNGEVEIEPVTDIEYVDLSGPRNR